eukprot:TRINITY_DN209_c1_g1_i1.p1 TRINITY_DN209_c1_g1~~TRINITY_DN209_c1_g1_i1.p1  ORF type:complete len:390 (-),score=38.63 TRINITY_DN209_c1_g1_i1:343-1512(-)
MLPLFLAIICLCFGGLFGLHHFYLKRDIHCFLYASAFGFLSFVGCLHDLFRLSDYVDDSMEEHLHMEQLSLQISRRTRPKLSISRLVAQLLFGFYFSCCFRYLLNPFDIFGESLLLAKISDALLSPIGVSVGVILAGIANGRQKTQYSKIVLATFIVHFCCYYFLFKTVVPEYLVAILSYHYYSSWDRTSSNSWSRRSGIFHRGFVLCTCVLVTWFFMAAFYYDMQIESSGSGTKLKHILRNVLDSEGWREFKKSWHSFWDEAHEHGWKHSSTHFFYRLDPSGRIKAYKTLELPFDVEQAERGIFPPLTLSELKKARNRLALIYHPDKQSASMKDIAQKKFLEIQSAFDALLPFVGSAPPNSDPNTTTTLRRTQQRKHQPDYDTEPSPP